MPRVAFHCDVCDHELEHHCPTCRQRDDDERNEAHAAEVADMKRSRAAHRASTLATPGVQDLEEILGVEVSVKYDGCDEDGEPSFVAHATWLCDAETRGYGSTAEAAVKALRCQATLDLCTILRALDPEGR